MSIRGIKSSVDDKIPVNTILVSVFDKEGISDFVNELIKINPNLCIVSSGGTYSHLKKYFEKNIVEVSDYTAFPEMEGGLVKTLHPKIYVGILGERNNIEHKRYLESIGGKYIDMVIVNLYPFSEVITRENSIFEDARGNIDIGGPASLRAAAKNFLGCVAVCGLDDYAPLVNEIRKGGGTTLATRFKLSIKTLKKIADYDAQIASYFSRFDLESQGVVDNYLTK
ncbi:hypothetical protein HYT23_02350 [Candidatus Pacearchaeota archaeon]|nr:hypothetical protein [Candidatus Pacearchaeota archaeon]